MPTFRYGRIISVEFDLWNLQAEGRGKEQNAGIFNLQRISWCVVLHNSLKSDALLFLKSVFFSPHLVLKVIEEEQLIPFKVSQE